MSRDIWVISDTHFGHENVSVEQINYRPINIEELRKW